MVQDDSINAFALVGGHIGVHTGLLTLTQNESELAGVMAHEIAHIVQRHQARAIAGQSRTAWSSIAALALAIIASRSSSSSQSGQVTEAALATASALQIQNMLDYTREHEREADRVGLTILERTGFDTRAMASFFERLLRANRLNEFKGAPSYLRTHPLTTERIAEIQDRIEGTPTRLVPDSLDYRLIKAKLRASANSPSEAASLFRNRLSERTIVRPREEVYGLAYALRRTREFDEAWKTLAPLREGQPPQPAFELLAGQILTDQGKTSEALTVYRNVLKTYPAHAQPRLRLLEPAVADRQCARRGRRPRRAPARDAGRLEALRNPGARLFSAKQAGGAASRAGRVLLPARQPERRRRPARDRGEGTHQRLLRSVERRIPPARDARAARERTRRREGAQDQLMRYLRHLPPFVAVALAMPCAAQGVAPPSAFVNADKGNCIACHQLPAGHGPATRADFGPALTGARMRELGRTKIQQAIDDPTRANPETVMPPFGRHRILDRAEIDRLVEYLLALP